MSDPDERTEPPSPLDPPVAPWWSTTPSGPDTDTDTDTDTESTTGSPSPVDPGAYSGLARTETGMLVAGPGVPSLDTRGAVPAEPVRRLPKPPSSDPGDPGSPSLDTDPDGGPVRDDPVRDDPVQDIAPAPAAASVETGNGQRLVVAVGSGIVAAAAVAVLTLAGLKALSGPSDQRDAAARSTAGPRPAGHQTAPDKPSSAVGIDDERTDPRPLTLREVFPNSRIVLDGHRYERDMTSVNHQCELTARSAMATALERAHCRGVIRATFVQGRRYAITTGVAIMPNRGAAIIASRAGDPSRYKWFRGMSGRVATDIDQAGGYAASTVRGRYIIYAYAQYADGTRPRVTDPTLKTLANRFVAYTARPIDQRARG